MHLYMTCCTNFSASLSKRFDCYWHEVVLGVNYDIFSCLMYGCFTGCWILSQMAWQWSVNLHMCWAWSHAIPSIFTLTMRQDLHHWASFNPHVIIQLTLWLPECLLFRQLCKWYHWATHVVVGIQCSSSKPSYEGILHWHSCRKHGFVFHMYSNPVGVSQRLCKSHRLVWDRWPWLVMLATSLLNEEHQQFVAEPWPLKLWICWGAQLQFCMSRWPPRLPGCTKMNL